MSFETTSPGKMSDQALYEKLKKELTALFDVQAKAGKNFDYQAITRAAATSAAADTARALIELDRYKPPQVK